ncbi:uncharacterized protein LOC62_01G000377 [Vanrija pseudolonga]|uniref:Uncharacterized protein n=1 Tax=Vanrija pseudolonga TaxID=143232 RepID=A0AAF0Y286_9TREE|nr:hypothetical protein LOC62_01G000377 [Vanrija pseudolonga]
MPDDGPLLAAAAVAAAPARHAQNSDAVHSPQSGESSGPGELRGERGMIGLMSSSTALQRHASGARSHSPQRAEAEAIGLARVDSMPVSSGCWQGQSGSGSGQMGHARDEEPVGSRGVRVADPRRGVEAYDRSTGLVL